MFRTLFKICTFVACLLVGLYLLNNCRGSWELKLPSHSEVSGFLTKVKKFHMDKTMPATILVEDKRYYKVIDTTISPTGVVDYITPEGDTLEIVKDFLKNIEIKTIEDINPKIEGICK